MLAEFRAFIAKGNVLELAVAVIIAGAFGTIVTSLTEDVIMPVIGWLFGGVDFSNYFILLTVPQGYQGLPTDYAALKEAGAAMIGYGALITAVVNFLLVRYANRVTAQLSKPKDDAPSGPTEIELLTEIRDELRRRG
jgi:large conductance mechanosensitive channel